MCAHEKRISPSVPVQNVCGSLSKVLPFLRIVKDVSLQQRRDKRRVHGTVGIISGVLRKVVAGVHKRGQNSLAGK